ncbi:VOC family protein [Oleiagrimonas soli]|uniref:Catechol 2,3-dioxygenase-like lactoylglutathione lyase family enzyme n=1 Tax=Oleiagrimonas soli TaxID=1543381 RepID=A0A841KNC7_9GAMM|nr:VOC family protein [Oleiagrimonas soli]MBB6185349.1 catechol 2,3-dioxygenase-like lactoylglutathione lyase family enzyme [Oleiagrimonas soli]
MPDTAFSIDHLDHLVIAVTDVETSMAFYQRVLGMRRIEFGAGRLALGFGDQKINVKPWTPALADLPCEAARPTPGSADLCLITTTPIATVMQHLARCGVPLDGPAPVQRTGARARLLSVYFRDPDGNLIEVSNELGNAMRSDDDTQAAVPV